MEKTIIIHNKADIEACGKLNSIHCNPVICLETGEVFTSVTDAAEKMGRSSQNLSSHLTGKRRHFAGRHYCYLSNAAESLNAIVARLRQTSSMEEDALKWRAYQAEQEAMRQEEERRQQAIADAKAKVDKCKVTCERLEEKQMMAEKKLVEAENELRALLGKNNCEYSEEVA